MNSFVKYLLVLINFLGFLVGINSYLPQLVETNPLLWLLVIDCPLAALLFIIYLLGFNNKYFEALMRFYCFKYGVWTIIVTFSSQSLLSYPLMPVNLLIHTGLIIESFMLMKQKLNFKHFTAALFVLLINDFSDYVLKTHPVINEELFLPTAGFTIVLSLITLLVFYKTYKRKNLT
ncbi:MAG: DUF1405 domain-containing protein [Nanoarchaeota archaeon]|nr:DUF1405 domain-containing protein [Nanoarchaeota archaeon]